MYPKDAVTMTQPWSTRGPSVRPFDDHGHQGDHQGPRREQVGVEQRDAEHRLAHVEEREQREIEQQAAEQEEPDEPLAPAAWFRHGSPRLLRGSASAAP